MMQKLQKFGAAMFVPVLLFSFAGMVVAFGSLFTNPEIFPHLAKTNTFWYGAWYTIEEGGWTLFRQIPILFVVGLPIGLAKKSQGRAALESIVTYLTFNYFIGAILNQWGPFFGVNNYSQNIVENSTNGGLTMIAGIKTLDTSIIGALIVGGIVVWLHNRYFDTKLPEWLGTFQGSAYVVILGYVASLFLAIITCFVWPKVQIGISDLQGFMRSSGLIGIWVYCFLERILIPTGLHHFVYIPFMWGPAAVSGGLQPWWLQHLTEFAGSTASLKSLAPLMGFTIFGNEKVFGVPAICFAFYATAKANKKKKTATLLIPAGLTSLFAGITEPVEFTFLFAAPVLWFVHAFLAATMDATMYGFGVVGQLDGGLIGMASQNWIPLWTNHWSTWVTQIIIGLIFSVIYFFVFKILIEKFNFVTPGRENDNEETKLINKKEYKNRKAGSKESNNDPYFPRATAFLEDLGGSTNIDEITSCATRLRVTVNNPEKVLDDATFKNDNAVGVVRHGKAIQVIVGLDVAQILEKIQDLIAGPVSASNNNIDNDKMLPISQESALIVDSVGMIDNVNSAISDHNNLIINVKDISKVDDPDIFISLGISVTNVEKDEKNKKVSITLPNSSRYAKEINGLSAHPKLANGSFNN